LKELQAQYETLQIIHKTAKSGTWPYNLKPLETNYIQTMLDKVFQDKKKIMWVRLNDYNYPRIALFLPEKYTKEVMCKARNSIFREHNATKNTYLKVP